MATTKFLIVNADDFGQTEGVNRGIIEAHERGIVTSASLMVRWPAAGRAAEFAKANPRLSLGLHLDFGEWICRNGGWIQLYQVADEREAAAAAMEMERQIEEFRRLTGRNPSHIDSHQHRHLREPLRSETLRIAERVGVPVRNLTGGVRYVGDFYGQMADGAPYPEGVGADHLVGILENLEAGITELGCHPGFAEDLDTMYRAERQKEVRTLCDPVIREAMERLGIDLCSFDCLPFQGKHDANRESTESTRR